MRYWFPIIALTTFHESCADKLRSMERIMESGECFAVVEDRQNEDHTAETKLDCELEDGEMIPVSGIDESWIIENLENGGLHSGLDSIKIPPGSKMRNGEVTVPSGENVTVYQNTRFRRLAGVTGVKTVLVARIEAPDSNTTSSEAEISDKVFGTSGDGLNLRSQYLACSHGKLDFEPKAKDDSLITTDGVTTVTISANVTGASDTEIRNAVLTALDEKFNVSSTQSIADYIILCIPPGTLGSWAAYAFVNSYLSVYNDDWCKSPSAQMHEVGHNLNLAHSGESAEYDDQSGMMGYSYTNDEAPAMCFNGPKNWQLGWFDDKRIELTPTEGIEYSFTMIGAAEYEQASDNEYVILKVGDKCYVSFNRKVGDNIGTVEGGDQVLVHKKEGTDYGQSYLLSKLSSGGSYSTAICDESGKDLEITAASIDTHALVTLCLGGNCAPAVSPTKSPTTAGLTQAPTLPAACKMIEISVQPDNFPEETNWTLSNECTGEIVASGGPYDKYDADVQLKTLCIPDEKYKFVIYDTFGDGICCSQGNGYYKGVFDGVEEFAGGSFGPWESHEFGSCNFWDYLDNW